MNEYRKTLLISVGDIKTNSLINTNVSDEYLSSAIMDAQEIYLEEIIGTALYRKLQLLVFNKINGDTPDIDEDENYRELLDEYIKPFLKARGTVNVLYNISFKIKNAGVVRNSDTNVNYAGMDEIKYLETQYSTAVDNYAQKLSKYICANKDNYEELSATIPSYFKAPQLGKTYANSSGLWLGDFSKNKCGC